MRLGVDQDVSWLDISVTYATVPEVGDSSQQLKSIDLDEDIWKTVAFAFMKVSGHSRQVLWHILHKQVKVDILFAPFFVILLLLSKMVMQQLHNVWMIEILDDVQLTIFVVIILQDFLDSNLLACLLQGTVAHHSEGSLANDPYINVVPVTIFALTTTAMVRVLPRMVACRSMCKPLGIH